MAKVGIEPRPLAPESETLQLGHCVHENKGADQLHHDRTADLGL